MFPLHQGNELFFQISPNPHKKHPISEDLILGPSSLDNTIDDKSLRRKPFPINNYSNDNENKKMMKHRDIERQRRQEMAILHASLRSLLPLELIKGKRSISDHINEAASYIKELQIKINELADKRDELKKFSKSTANFSFQGSGSSTSSSQPVGFFTIQKTCGGVQVVISTSGFIEDGLPLSRVLGLLVHEGLIVVSCLSTKVNGRLLHTIQSEASDKKCVNLTELEQKLNEVIPSSLFI